MQITTVEKYSISTERMYSFFSIVFSVSYAAMLSGLPVDRFVDRANYLDFVTNSVVLLRENLSSRLITLLQNEPVWLFINISLGAFLEPDVALRFIIFASSLLFSLSIMRISKDDPKYFVFAMLICLLPQVMKNYIVHLRQGVAIAIFAFSLTSASVVIRRIGLILAPFIHASFFFVAINLVFSWFAKKNFGVSKTTNFFVMLFVLYLSNFFLLFLLDYFDARQIQEYESLDFIPRTGAAFLFWMVILFVIFLNGVSFGVKNFFVIASIVSYLVLYFTFNPVARIFESALPFVLVAGYQLAKSKRRLFFLMFGILFVYQWLVPLLLGSDIFGPDHGVGPPTPF